MCINRKVVSNLAPAPALALGASFAAVSRLLPHRYPIPPSIAPAPALPRRSDPRTAGATARTCAGERTTIKH